MSEFGGVFPPPGRGIEAVRNALMVATEKLWNPEVQGSENLGIFLQGTPVIVAFYPHTTHFDNAAVRFPFPKEYRNRLIHPTDGGYWKGLMRLLQISVAEGYPLYGDKTQARETGLEQGIQTAVEYLADGYSMVLSPQGSRKQKAGGHYFGRTTSDIAIRSGAPIIPVLLNNLAEIMPVGHRLPIITNRSQLPRPQVSIHEPFTIDTLDNGVHRDTLLSIMQELWEVSFGNNGV